jgi:hypothetical protein
VTKFNSIALLPFKRGKHQLTFSNGPAKEHRHIREACRWCFRHQIGHLSIERTIDNHPQGTFVRVMLGNEKHGATEIWIEHVGMCDQQRTGKGARGWFVI